ncbi:hypothetical protein [Candidatus Nitrosacidococcus sp. I8]|uniref:hypothetical protein n=1 Tax=Candidatus Nitrosacidococcus sp. I8 TaxID=2942908 RepID=UPI002228059B|nr:hypothetical protein [Candidatus Nitrosacidococcus sp. I8]CAH9017740.1 hypothetical protein NURINAE_00526 [Candidatus Nitrosacidococcus sp. I8]
MKRRKKIPAFSQKGLVTLTAAIGMSLLTAVTTLHTANMDITGQKISSNSLSTSQNFSTANAAANQDINSIINNPNLADPTNLLWRACNSRFPCSVRAKYNDIPSWKYQANDNVGIQNQQSFLLQNITNPSVIIAVTQGSSPTGGQTIVQRGLYLISSSIPGPVRAPLVSGSAITLSGNVSFGDGTMAIWAKNAVQMSGNLTIGGDISSTSSIAASGNITFNGDLSATNGVSKNGNITLNGDIYNPSGSNSAPPPTPVPSDLFQYVFNTPVSNAQSIQNQATQLSNCNQWSGNKTVSGGVYWITGNCTISDNVTLGTASNPVIIIATGNVTITGNTTMNGLLYSYQNITASGNSVQGTLVANGTITASGNLTYNSGILKKAYQGIAIGSGGLVSVPYSWIDGG